jgi:hypothetical protein
MQSESGPNKLALWIMTGIIAPLLVGFIILWFDKNWDGSGPKPPKIIAGPNDEFARRLGRVKENNKATTDAMWRSVERQGESNRHFAESLSGPIGASKSKPLPSSDDDSARRMERIKESNKATIDAMWRSVERQSESNRRFAESLSR